MRFLFLLSVLIIAANLPGQTQEALIYGKVSDNETLEALIGATISLNSNEGTISDGKGNYQIMIPSGKVKLNFQYIGYVPVVKNLDFNPSDTIEINVALSKSVNEIEQIVVSANKAEQKLSDLTISMSLIKPYYINNNHISDPQDLLNKTPGIEVLDGQASIRGGSGFSYGAGSRVMALIDGLPALAIDAGNIKWQYLPLENLSQVEIIKGASSVMYGSSAINGVINFRTSVAGPEPITKFHTEIGIFDNPSNKDWKWWDSPRLYTTTSISNLQKIGNTDLGISGNILIDNGYRKLDNNKSGRVNMRLINHSKTIDGLQYGTGINSGFSRKTDFILWEDAEFGALKQSETTANELHATFFTFDPFLTYHKDDITNHEFRMRMQYSSNKFPNGEQTNSDAYSIYSEYQFQHSLGTYLKLNLGLAETFGRVLSNFYGNHSLVNVAGFGQLDYDTQKKIKIIAGVRLEQNFIDGISDKWVPIFRSGLNYKIGKLSFLRTSFGQGYRYPSIAEKYASTSLGSIKIFPNDEVRSEKGWNSEIGFKQGIVHSKISGMLDLAVFYSQNKDMIEYVFGLYPDPLSENFEFGFKATNIEHSKVYGTEMNFNLNWTTGEIHSTLSGGYLYLYPVEFINSDKYLKYRRKHSASLNLNTRIRQFDLGINLYAKSKILQVDNVFINEFTREDILPGFYDYWLSNNKGYLLTDLITGLRISQKIKLSFAIKNLFNIEYMGRPGDIRPHRNYSVRLSGVF